MSVVLGTIGPIEVIARMLAREVPYRVISSYDCAPLCVREWGTSQRACSIHDFLHKKAEMQRSKSRRRKG